MGAIGSQCKPTNDERETIIRWDDSGNECIIYTCNKTLIARLDRYVKHNPSQWKLNIAHKDGAREYITTKKLVTIREKSIKSTMTEEQKQAAAERLKKSREK